ncbi:MAG: truA [Ferruginibacter sp.]|nr:truA [Ferruginibacter sp.]
MQRYFIEVFYRGTHYAGFQIQQNANSIQAEVEKALHTFFRDHFQLTCSSRTDAGVHALSNFFHFDAGPGYSIIACSNDALKKAVYNLNAIIPGDIVIRQIFKVDANAHCRFDATSRSYHYYIYQDKNPFLADRSFFYPYKLDIALLQEAADLLLAFTDFTSFSKKHTQVKSFNCRIMKSEWSRKQDSIVYHVEANRFLRGMVRGLVGTMLKVGTGKILSREFKEIIEAKDNARADFSVPAHGLFLSKVNFNPNKSGLPGTF